MRLLARHTALVALLLLTASEALIVQWALLATGRGALGLLGFVGLLPVVAGVNFVLIFWLRPRSRSGLSAYVMSRVIMLGSMAALLTGPLLFASFAIVALPLFAVHGSIEPGPVARAALVAGGGVAVAVGFGTIWVALALYSFGIGRSRIDRPGSRI